jgi:hypothetical protein
MIYGAKADSAGRWFRIQEGPKMRFHGRWPTASEWDAYMSSIQSARSSVVLPGEMTPSVDVGKMYAAMRACGRPCVTGIEVDGEIPDFSLATALSLGPCQEAFFDFAGFLFRGASEFCDDGTPGDEAA